MRSFFKDIAKVSIGNVVGLIGNILVGFLLPLILSVEDYGLYKTYTLYVTYSGLLHFGFVDGVLLTYGGNKYEELEKPKFRCYTRLFMVVEAIVAIIITCFSLVVLKSDIKIIIILVSVNIIWTNITLYYQYVSQATFRFKEFSSRKIIQSSALIGVLIVLFLLKHFRFHINAYTYIAIVQTISFLLLVWYITTYKDITFGKAERISDNRYEIISIVKRGAMLTIAYEVSTLALQLDRQFVSILFGIEVYAKYAFAYNILSCFTALIRSVSVVLFPELKRMKQENAIKYFSPGIAGISIIVFFFQIGYYPIKWIIEWILPNYTDSLVYFQIIFPVLALSSCITIICYTFYKLLDKTKQLFLVGLFALINAIVLNYLAYHIFGTPESISVASIFSTIAWYVVAVLYLHRKYQTPWFKNFLYCVIMLCAFYITTFFIQISWLSIVSYSVVFIMVTFAFYKELIKQLVKTRKLH